MTKWLSKWLRKSHRWIAVPTAIAILLAVGVKMVGSPDMAQTWEKLDKIPSLFMLVMALSGIYLFLVPYIVKGQRRKRLASKGEG